VDKEIIKSLGTNFSFGDELQQTELEYVPRECEILDLIANFSGP